MSAFLSIKSFVKPVLFHSTEKLDAGRSPAMKCSGQVECTKVWTRPQCTPPFSSTSWHDPRPAEFGTQTVHETLWCARVCLLWVFTQERNSPRIVLRCVPCFYSIRFFRELVYKLRNKSCAQKKSQNTSRTFSRSVSRCFSHVFAHHFRSTLTEHTCFPQHWPQQPEDLQFAIEHLRLE